MWYSKFSVSNLQVRTYLRKGKEKLVVTWNYQSLGGSAREVGNQLPANQFFPQTCDIDLA